MTTQRTNPQSVARVFKSKAKLFWGISVVIKISIIVAPFVISLLSLNLDQKFVLYSLTLATLLSAIFLSISDSKRVVAEDIKRQSEFYFGLGIDYDYEHIHSITSGFNSKLRESVKSTEDSKNSFWLTKKEVGNERFLEMLHESSWFSRNLSNLISNLLAAFIIFIVITVFSLIYFIGNGSISGDTSKFIAIAFNSAITIGFIQSFLRYRNFSKSCEAVYKEAKLYLSSGAYNEVKITRLWSEYHIARSSSPLIPEFVYKRKRNGLNESYSEIYSLLLKK